MSHLDDLFLRAWQLEVAPVKGFALSCAAPHGVCAIRALLLMRSDHAGAHEEDAHVHIGTRICAAHSKALVITGCTPWSHVNLAGLHKEGSRTRSSTCTVKHASVIASCTHWPVPHDMSVIRARQEDANICSRNSLCKKVLHVLP